VEALEMAVAIDTRLENAPNCWRRTIVSAATSNGRLARTALSPNRADRWPAYPVSAEVAAAFVVKRAYWI